MPWRRGAAVPVRDAGLRALAISCGRERIAAAMGLLYNLIARAMPSVAAVAARNAELCAELEARRAAEESLRAAYAELEARASERTAEATRAHDQLQQEIQDRRRTEQSLRYSETLLRRLHEDLEDHIAERTVELTKTIAELEAFSYSISHDLRAPLRAINGFAAILREEHAEGMDAEGDALLMKIETNAAKMAQLIDGLLDFSRLARAESVSAEVDMAALVRSVVTELAGDERSRRPAIVVGELPRVVGDEAMLRQVWVNLVSNALKFSAPRGDARIEIDAAARDGEIVFNVRDNGVGFDMTYAEKLFGVFNRLHRADEFPGVGVGLALTRRIVTRHGGRIWAESRPGEGAVFHFSLPATPARRAA
jgi:signal transduction histidine kinase